jgi:hypothetical protein
MDFRDIGREDSLFLRKGKMLRVTSAARVFKQVDAEEALATARREGDLDPAAGDRQALVLRDSRLSTSRRGDRKPRSGRRRWRSKQPGPV